MGNALTALLTHPDVLDRVRADRTLLPAVIEETLRWETSVTQVSRVAAVDAEVGGCPIPKGAAVSVHHRLGEPRRGPLRPRRTSSTSTGRSRTTSRSAPGSTSASACTWRASSCASAST